MGCFPVFWRKKKSRSQIVQHDQGKLFLSIEPYCSSFDSVPSDVPIRGNVKIYSSKELRKAIRNFCLGNKLGQGSFGHVYLVG
jgi:hypothetical protein